MKSTIEGNVKRDEYPCLKESDRHVVLFYSPKGGTVVHSKKGGFYRIGHHDCHWCEELFEPCTGRVILEND